MAHSDNNGRPWALRIVGRVLRAIGEPIGRFGYRLEWGPPPPDRFDESDDEGGSPIEYALQIMNHRRD